jgi:hypothetical protein
MPKCDYCGSEFILGDGIYDDGDFMCGHCIAGYANDYLSQRVIQDSSASGNWNKPNQARKSKIERPKLKKKSHNR